MTPGKRYLHELRRALPWTARRRVVAEFRHHLEDGITAEIAGGLDYDEAERVTIDRLGPPERAAAQFATVTPKRGRLAIVVVAVVVLVTALAAGVVVTHTNHAKPAAKPRSSISPRALRTMREALAGVTVRTIYVSDGRVVLSPKTGIVVRVVPGKRIVFVPAQVHR